MKKVSLLIVAALLAASGLFAQNEGVSISKTESIPHESAILDVQSDKKGMLMPRVALTGITDDVTVKNAANGLFVFSEIGDVVGSYQKDKFERHSHAPSGGTLIVFGAGGSPYAAGSGYLLTIAGLNNEGGSETRPKNAYVNYIIKY